MAVPNTPPKYIYKILPSHPAPGSPLPRTLPLSPLDSRDGFIHLSTSRQILRTLNAFFGVDPHVFILRVPYARLQKYIKWEDSKGTPFDVKGGWDTEGAARHFPHVYGNDVEGIGEKGLKLGRDEVDEFGKWVRKGAAWTAEGWPFAEDIPVTKE